MKQLITFLISLFLSFNVLAKAGDCDEICKKQQVEVYLEHIVKIFIDGSTESDIDEFLVQLHENIKYEHPEYGANFDKKSWRKAFVRQLNLGNYTDTPNLKGGIINIIYGKHHAAVEYSYGKTQNDGRWQKDHVKFALFGFTDGKVSLVREYW